MFPIERKKEIKNPEEEDPPRSPLEAHGTNSLRRVLFLWVLD